MRAVGQPRKMSTGLWQEQVSYDQQFQDKLIWAHSAFVCACSGMRPAESWCLEEREKAGVPKFGQVKGEGQVNRQL